MLAAIACQQLGYILTSISVQKWWYVLNGLTHLILWFGMFMAINRQRLYNRWSWRIGVYGIALASNQFFDEFVGNPAKLGWNELLIVVLIGVDICVALYKEGKLYERKH